MIWYDADTSSTSHFPCGKAFWCTVQVPLPFSTWCSSQLKPALITCAPGSASVSAQGYIVLKWGVFQCRAAIFLLWGLANNLAVLGDALIIWQYTYNIKEDQACSYTRCPTVHTLSLLLVNLLIHPFWCFQWSRSER